jgi:hypothetical protein
MKWSLESLSNEYNSLHEPDESSLGFGLGYTVLKAFYGSLGIQSPITADLSVNLLRSCVGFVLLYPAYSSFALADLRKFLLFIYKKGGTRVDYSNVIGSASQSSSQVCKQHPRWKS